MPEGKLKGISLIELLLCVAIVSVLITLTAPNLSSLLGKLRADSAITALHQDLQFSRITAINYQRFVTLCPLANNHCSGDWSQGYQVFIDLEPYRQLDPNDTVLRVKAPLSPQDTLDNSANSLGLLFSPWGFTNNNSSFVYCANSTSNASQTKLVISRAGRTRAQATDADDNCL